jgi:hypothetical protein
MHEEQRLNIIISLAESYRFEKPLVRFLRNYFRAHRNMGSRDRKIVTQSVYSFFAWVNLFFATFPEQIAIGYFFAPKKQMLLLLVYSK